MAHVPGLRTPYAKVGRLVYFGRMLDKIRLHAAGKLPGDYLDNLGDSKPGMFDTRCCEFLKVPYADIQAKVLTGASDDEVLAWAEQQGGRRSDDDVAMWNTFLRKRGYQDHPDVSARLRMRVKQSGLEGKPIETFFDYIDYDEGRDNAVLRPWEGV